MRPPVPSLPRSALAPLLVSAALLLGACAGDGEAEQSDPEPPEATAPGAEEPAGDPVPVRVTGSLQELQQGWVLCPGSVAPCWPVVDAGDDLEVGPVVATGIWDRDTIRLDAVEPPPDEVAPSDAGLSPEALQAVLDDAAERWPSWGDAGWVVLSGSVDTDAGRVVIAFDEIDPRLRDEVVSTWADVIEIRANVEVLEGSVDALTLPPAPGEIPLATQPRGSAGMGETGRFTLRYDDQLECLWFEDEDGERVKPIWPHGFRAMPDPVRVLDGAGRDLAAAGQSFEVNGGFGRVLPDSDDPTDCGATEVFVISPN